MNYEVNSVVSSIRLTSEEEAKLVTLEEELKSRYQELYDIVEKGKQTGEDTEAIKEMSNSILELHDQINQLNGQIEKAEDILEELKWLQKELSDLCDFDPKNERIPFRGDISSGRKSCL